MDIRSFFGTTSTLTSKQGSSNKDDSDEEQLGPGPSKKQCSISASTSVRKYSKKWEKEFSWLQYDEDSEGAFCKICRTFGSSSMQHSRGVWITTPFTNWKKAVDRMRAHEKSSVHTNATQAALDAQLTMQQGSVLQQLQKSNGQERMRNRAAIKSFIRCTHFLTRQHIPHTTNFDKIVDLVISCGGEDLKHFLETTGRNALYTSHVAVVDFVEALGTWVEESILKRLQKASHYSIMADECTDIATLEEMSVFCRWEENGVPVEHFLEIIHLKKADAESIFSALVDCLKEKNLQVSKIVGMGFDGAATFSGKKSGVQTRFKNVAPHALFVHCHCHLLQLACVQAANSTPGMKQVYVTLTSLWKYFHFSPKRAQSLKEIQNVLDLPELKVAKPSDTRWLAHERCVKAVKSVYAAIVTTLDNIYEQLHEPEALGLSKALSKTKTIAAIFLLDYTLPQVAKLSKVLQTENLDLSVVGSLVDATLHTLEDAMLPAANWVLELSEEASTLESVTGIKITQEDIRTFLEKVAKPFVTLLKGNISSRFTSSGAILSAFSIFDPKKVPSADLATYGEDAIETLLAHYGTNKPAETLQGEATMREGVISQEIRTEWKTFRQFMAKQPKEDMKLQMRELASNDMLMTMFPNLSTLAVISLSIPVTTASVERSFSKMKLIKTRLRSCLSDTSLSHLMKIAIESPNTLSDEELEQIVDVWNRKGRRIAV